MYHSNIHYKLKYTEKRQEEKDSLIRDKANQQNQKSPSTPFPITRPVSILSGTWTVLDLGHIRGLCPSSHTAVCRPRGTVVSSANAKGPLPGAVGGGQSLAG